MSTESKAAQPKCVGYPVCDGMLVGEAHDGRCPLAGTFGPQAGPSYAALEEVNKELLEALENTTQTLRLILAAVAIDDYPAEARQEVRKEIALAEAVIAKAQVTK